MAYGTPGALSDALLVAARATAEPSLDPHVPADVRVLLVRLDALLAYASGWVGASCPQPPAASPDPPATPA